MGIQDDIKTLKTLEEQFRADYGRYFETDNEKPFVVPIEGTDLKTTKLSRFKKGFAALSGAPDTISFTPTAKDYHFIIGNGTRRIKGKEFYCYMITAIRKNALSKEVEKVFYRGGDKEAFDH